MICVFEVYDYAETQQLQFECKQKILWSGIPEEAEEYFMQRVGSPVLTWMRVLSDLPEGPKSSTVHPP